MSNILIIGSKGQLGSYFMNNYIGDDTIIGFDQDKCDISDFDSLTKIVNEICPKLIINCSAYNLVDDAEIDNTPAMKVNFYGTENLAKVAASVGSFLVHYSTDYVYDGNKGDLFNENDDTNPINEYGKSKLLGELAVKEHLDNYLILRLSWLFGDGTQNFIYKLSQWAKNNKILKITSDEYSIPTSTKFVFDYTMLLIKKGSKGVFNMSPDGMASRFNWAEEIVKQMALDVELQAVPIESFNLPAKRPYNSSMDNQKLKNELNLKDFPSWQDSMSDFIRLKKRN